MSGRYERVDAHDAHDHVSPPHHHPPPTPSSPPPSFRSRASSVTLSTNQRNRRVNDPALADAFDADDSEDDDEPDDRQRLVRQTSGPVMMTTTTASGSAQHTPANSTPSLEPLRSAVNLQGRVYGGGIENGGVFSNLTAKPEKKTGPEKEEMPPTYEQAAADAAPPYWETTILAPGLGGPDEVYIDGMPVGSLFSFVWNGMISMSFQVVGFLLTYLLHSTHAAKNGSRAGLGVTLIQYGFYMKTGDGGSGSGSMAGDGSMPGDGFTAPPDPNSHDFDPGAVQGGGGGGGGSGAGGNESSGGFVEVAGGEWMAYILMIIGWFILIRSISDFLKARRHEQLVLQSPDRGLGVPIIAEGEDTEHVV